MTTKTTTDEATAIALRKNADACSGPALDGDTTAALLHELRVHQIELGMQNEALRSSQLALEDARDRYVHLFEFAPVGYLTLSRNGIIDEINLTATRMLGVERVQLLGHRLVEFVQNADRDRCHVFLRKLCTAPAEHACEVCMQRPDDELLPVRLNGTALPSEQGPNVPSGQGSFALRITLTDISESRQLAALNETAMRLRLAVEAIPGGLYDWNRDTGSLYWHSTLSEGCKFKDRGMIPDRRWWHQCVHADDLRRIRPVLTDAIKRGRLRFGVEYRMRCHDGSWCHVLDRAQILRDANGRVTRFVGTLTDITAYKETAQRQAMLKEALETQVATRTAESERRARDLADAERFARETIDSLDTRLCVLDEAGEIIATNRAWREFEASEIDCSHAAPAEDGDSLPYGMACWTSGAKDRVKQAVADILTGRRMAFSFEYECASEAGSHWFEMFITRFAGSGPTRLVIRHREITERKLSELEQRRSAERIKQLGRHVDAMSEAKNAAIARELHDELGASLTMLKLGLATLAERPAQRETKETFGALLQQVDTALQVTRRISGSLRPPTLDTLGLAATVRSHVAQYALTTGIATTLRLAKDHFDLSNATTIAVFRIIQEALTNVAKHAGASRVVISVRCYRGTLIVRIVDNGNGIGEAAVQRPGAFGIIGMRERAQHVGGTLTLGRRALGNGTRLTLRVPTGSDAMHPAQRTAAV